MIKLEITNVELLNEDDLRATAHYLLDLSNKKNTHKHPSEGVGEWNGDKKEQANNLKKMAEKIGKQLLDKIVPPVQSVSVDDQLDMHQLAGTDPLEIEEELIPVSAEEVNAPAPSAAEIFNPVNGLNLPTIPRPACELDIHGMPWDVRIHARTKTKMKDGSWKKLRGVGPNVVKHVEEELKTVQNIPAPPVVPIAPNSVEPVAPSAPGFMDLMGLVTKSITEGTLKRDQVDGILKPLGIASLALVSTRLDLIPSIMLSIEGVVNAPR